MKIAVKRDETEKVQAFAAQKEEIRQAIKTEAQNRNAGENEPPPRDGWGRVDIW